MLFLPFDGLPAGLDDRTDLFNWLLAVGALLNSTACAEGGQRGTSLFLTQLHSATIAPTWSQYFDDGAHGGQPFSCSVTDEAAMRDDALGASSCVRLESCAQATALLSAGTLRTARCVRVLFNPRSNCSCPVPTTTAHWGTPAKHRGAQASSTLRSNCSVPHMLSLTRAAAMLRAQRREVPTLRPSVHVRAAHARALQLLGLRNGGYGYAHVRRHDKTNASVRAGAGGAGGGGGAGSGAGVGGVGNVANVAPTLRAEMCTAPKRLVRRLAAQPQISTWLVSVYEYPERLAAYMQELHVAVSSYLLSGAHRRVLYEPQVLATLRRDERDDNYFVYAVEKLLMAHAAALVDTHACRHGALPRKFRAGFSSEARAEARARTGRMWRWSLLRGVAVVAGGCVGVGAVVVVWPRWRRARSRGVVE